MSDEPEVRFEYVGQGWIIGLPAADLTQADLEAAAARTGRDVADIEDLVRRSGLYTLPGGEPIKADLEQLDKAEKQALADQHGLEVEGSGSDGNVLVADLDQALRAAGLAE